MLCSVGHSICVLIPLKGEPRSEPYKLFTELAVVISAWLAY